jgi:hypothetical protein
MNRALDNSPGCSGDIAADLGRVVNHRSGGLGDRHQCVIPGFPSALQDADRDSLGRITQVRTYLHGPFDRASGEVPDGFDRRSADLSGALDRTGGRSRDALHHRGKDVTSAADRLDNPIHDRMRVVSMKKGFLLLPP